MKHFEFRSLFGMEMLPFELYKHYEKQMGLVVVYLMTRDRGVQFKPHQR